MVDWLLTEQLMEIFQEAQKKRPTLNAELVARSPLGEEDVLAGAGAVARIHATDGAELVVTPRRIKRVVDERGLDLVRFEDLVGYDWITPEMSEKVDQKDEHWDRLYLYPRDAPPVILDHLGEAVYPLMTFLGRVLEFRSEKVLRRKLDDDVVALLGRCLTAAARGPFFTDPELGDLVVFRPGERDGVGHVRLRHIPGWIIRPVQRMQERNPHVTLYCVHGVRRIQESEDVAQRS